MTDTAQPVAAAENVSAQFDNAADAFRSFLEPTNDKPRDEQGRFAPADTEDEPDGAEAPEDQTGDEDEDEDAEVAADEAQPDAVDMPSSWSSEDADAWEALTPEAKAVVAERERQRDIAVNQKFQEAANIRKANEAVVNEANANRERYAAAIDEVLSLVQMDRPDPMHYGLGTDSFDRDSYDLALYQFEQAQTTVTALHQQRQYLAAQQEQQAEMDRSAAHAAIEQQAWPKFLADVPDLADTAKGRQIIADVVNYAKQSGIPESVFDDPAMAKTLTSAELHLTWKAMQYDRIKAAEKRVKAGNPPPKPASPTVKPGGVTSRQTVQANRLGKAQDRLAKEGSIEAGAAVFKQLFKGL